MKAYVYTDKGLERYAGRFVWLSINTEAPETAAFLKRYPIAALPMLLVLDPNRDTVHARYVGGANVTQIKKILDDADQSYRAHAAATADRLLVEADRQAAEGQNAASIKSYESAIASAPSRWSRLGRAAESLMFALSGQPERCAARAAELYPRVKGTVSAANVAATGLSCAVSLNSEHPKRATLLATLEKATQEVFDNKKIVMSDDDRSGLYIALIEARDAAGDEESVIALKMEWSRFLDTAAARAKTPEQRSVYDAHRLTAYVDLGMPEKAIPMLEQSERDFPQDYNPPARLAYAYKVMNDLDKALAASDRALAKVYGPRKLSVLSVRADIYEAKGDKPAARETLRQAIDYARSLPEGQRSERRIGALEKRLREIEN
jgi:tetratricopeptide (TPR) repeat protein